MRERHIVAVTAADRHRIRLQQHEFDARRLPYLQIRRHGRCPSHPTPTCSVEYQRLWVTSIHRWHRRVPPGRNDRLHIDNALVSPPTDGDDMPSSLGYPDTTT